ncbi:MAG: septation protein SpoVG family protein [Patescibacteria group bacterium]|nr:septation protein SpoVG family protein [Patescibacteria group bacterium]
MKISEIQIIPVKANEGLVAFASCVLDDSYFIGSIAIFTRLAGGYRLVYPTKKIGDKNLNYHHPISREASQSLEEAIIGKAELILNISQMK